MALVKVIADNLLSGANLRKLEVGSDVEIDNKTAQRWEKAGQVEIISDDDRVFEVATPGDTPAEQAKAAKSKKGK
ncbi:hypothetical protein D0525_16380 [Salmonella enterica]|uniref:hypothetical protein n=1 Tax=Salmonella enterica TaxID=28901 RepID=UPI001010E1B3|nr:hypothetical protein [Salmonella enterica]RXO38247.1 hypothetical protein D0525_16380 [Salmonella enterica]